MILFVVCFSSFLKIKHGFISLSCLLILETMLLYIRLVFFCINGGKGAMVVKGAASLQTTSFLIKI